MFCLEGQDQEPTVLYLEHKHADSIRWRLLKTIGKRLHRGTRQGADAERLTEEPKADRAEWHLPYM